MTSGYRFDVPPGRTSAEDRQVRFVGTVRPARGRSRTVVLVVAALVAVALVVSARWWTSAVLGSVAPPPGHEEARLPLGAPPLESALDSGPYAFTATQPDGSGAPVTYSPCRPIHYVVRPDGEPAEGAALLSAALDRVSKATGLVFVADGSTDESPSDDRAAYQPDRYGKRWAPVLVAWSTAAESPELAGDVAGVGGSASVTHEDHATYVTGQVTLDTEDLVRLLAGPNGAAVALGVVTHEIGHVVGLAHVQDAGQLMYPSTNLAVTSFAAGDRAGLALLGTGRCARDV